ncbi:hypothetical protein POX_f07631 [Penicillium oxalicum]|uniref:Uncharacterized protein n=1 Tax=Penicillium oxalicum (strain 114-2 / CGMCC 5302) TaxID=933388 RepID=S8B2A6_PENO1|nr:hypothetical protein POX_f07631 [Penicillium oxalicum]EPS28547.1 hypothetical protein PDE_03493 [Penicillium oxalicum 114-2]KAI2787268.1 hypothetical protein POX_f07631 [Penicillium oxalicum]
MRVEDGENSIQKWRTTRGWLPRTLHRPYLFTLAGLFTFMLAAVETLRQWAKRQGGIVHWAYESDLPTAIWGAYTYLPLAFALLAINLFDACAQDVLRLEPFFQLAKAEGVSASMLFTNYCSNTLAASFMAVRNRNWIVLAVAPVSLAFRMFLPSLLAGLVELDDGIWTENKVVNTWPSIIDLDSQKVWLTSGSSGNGPLGSPELNAFFMPDPEDFTTAPVSLPDDQNNSSLLTLTQDVFWSNLTCSSHSEGVAYPQVVTDLSSASHLPHGQQIWSWNIENALMENSVNGSSNSQCQVSVILNTLIGADSMTVQARFWEPVDSAGNMVAPSAFTTSGCSSSFKVFGVMIDMDLAAGNVSSANYTMFACSTVYQQALADVTLDSNATVASVNMTPAAVKPLNSQDFLVEGVHDLIASRYLSTTTDVRVESSSQGNIFANSSGAILVATDSNVQNTTSYQQQIRQYWNYEFIVTIDRFFSPGGPPTSADAQQKSLVVILMVASDAVTLVEAILGIGLVAIAILLSIYPNRPNFLQWDPGSISAQCTLIARLFTSSSKVMFAEAKLHMANTRQLKRWAKGKSCEWVVEDGEERIRVVDCPVPPSTRPSRFINNRPDPMPHFLRPMIFLAECFVIAAILTLFGVSLSYIRWKSINSFFSTGATVAMVFLNFGPTAIASVIGSFLLSVYRNLTAMEPWIRLQDGLADARQSIVENYAIQTPLVPLFLQRHRKPGILLFASIVCLGDLVLRLLSGGIFTPQLKRYSSPTSALSHVYRPGLLFNNSYKTNIDISLVATSRLLNNVTILPWATVDGSFFFTPYSVHNPSDDNYPIYITTTRGYGVDLDCEELPLTSAADVQSWTYTIPVGSTQETCSVEIALTERQKHSTRQSVHYYAPNGTNPACQESSLFVWASWEARSSKHKNESSVLALHCEPRLHIQDFRVEFDSDGTIEILHPVIGSEVTSGELYQNASALLKIFNQMLLGPHENITSRWGGTATSQHRTHSYHYNWPGSLTSNSYTNKYSKDSILRPSHFISTVQGVYKTLFSTHLALWGDQYFDRLPSSSPHPARGNVVDSFWGFIPATSLVVIIICLLSIDAVALMTVFTVRFKRYRGHRVPRTLGSLIPWVVESRMLADLGATWEMSGRERDKHLLEQDRKYRVGDFSATGGPPWALDYDDDLRRDDPPRDSEIELQNRGSDGPSNERE